MEKWHITKIRLNQGGYTSQGWYFGSSLLSLYQCWNDEDTHYFRADNRQHAKEQLQDMYKDETILTYR